MLWSGSRHDDTWSASLDDAPGGVSNKGSVNWFEPALLCVVASSVIEPELCSGCSVELISLDVL